LIGLAYHYLGEAALNRLMEAVMASNLLEKVLADAWETGRVEGRVERSREMLLKFLTGRFGSLPSGLDVRIGEISDTERLDSLADLAARAATLEEFLAAL